MIGICLCGMSNVCVVYEWYGWDVSGMFEWYGCGVRVVCECCGCVVC